MPQAGCSASSVIGVYEPGDEHEDHRVVHAPQPGPHVRRPVAGVVDGADPEEAGERHREDARRRRGPTPPGSAARARGRPGSTPGRRRGGSGPASVGFGRRRLRRRSSSVAWASIQARAAVPRAACARMIDPARESLEFVSVLTVRDLVVEVGAKRIVDGVTLQVRPGEKVGLVGRNGAGQDHPAPGARGCRPARGPAASAGPSSPATSPRTLAATPSPTTPPSSPTCSRAAASTTCSTAAGEAAHRARGDTRRPSNIERFSAAQERSRRRVATRPRPRCASSPTASASAPTGSTCTLGALSGGERRRAELVRILFGGSELLLLDEPTNHLDADARTWLLKFLRVVPRRAARGEPRPRPARRGDHPRRAHRP